MLGEFTICTGMFRNGVWTGMTVVTAFVAAATTTPATTTASRRMSTTLTKTAVEHALASALFLFSQVNNAYVFGLCGNAKIFYARALWSRPQP